MKFSELKNLDYFFFLTDLEHLDTVAVPIYQKTGMKEATFKDSKYQTPIVVNRIPDGREVRKVAGIKV